MDYKISTSPNALTSKYVGIRLSNGTSFNMHYFDSNDRQTDSSDIEKTVLFVHGLGANSTIWEPCIESLINQNPSVRCLALDLPHHGESLVNRSLEMHSLIESIHLFLERLNIEKVCLVGHSFGACLLMHSHNNPLHTSRISQYFLISPMGIQPLNNRQKRLIKNIYDVKFLIKFGKTGSYSSFKKYFTDYTSEYERAWKKLEKDIDRDPIKYFHSVSDLIHSVIDNYDLSLTSIFERIHFVIGKNDILIPSQMLRVDYTLLDLKKMNMRYFPNSEWIFLDDCGHYPQLEHKHDIVNLIMQNL